MILDDMLNADILNSINKFWKGKRQHLRMFHDNVFGQVLLVEIDHEHLEAIFKYSKSTCALLSAGSQTGGWRSLLYMRLEHYIQIQVEKLPYMQFGEGLLVVNDTCKKMNGYRYFFCRKTSLVCKRFVTLSEWIPFPQDKVVISFSASWASLRYS